MGWFRRRKEQFQGYEDRAALKGFGGYEPAEPTPPTFGTSPQPLTPSSRPLTPSSQPPLPTASPEPSSSEASGPRRGRKVGSVVGLIPVFFFGLLYSFFGGDTDDEDESFVDYSPPPPRPETRVVAPPAVKGWQSVVHSDGVYAYDVPPDWEPGPDTIHGWESDGSQYVLVTSAFVDEGFCPGDETLQRGGSGMATASGNDAAAAATEQVEELARYAYTPDGGEEPKVEVVERRSVKVSIAEGTRAELVLAEVTVTDPGEEECLPEKALVGALAVEPPEKEKSVPVLMVYEGRVGSDSPSESDFVRILTSLRTVPEDELETTVVTPTR